MSIIYCMLITLLVLVSPSTFSNTDEEDMDVRTVTANLMANKTLRYLDENLNRSLCPRMMRSLNTMTKEIADGFLYRMQFEICNNRTMCEENHECTRFCQFTGNKDSVYIDCKICKVEVDDIPWEKKFFIKRVKCDPPGPDKPDKLRFHS